VWLCERGALARTVVVIRSTVEPIWAGPSLRIIFINKNIAAYCRYIGLIRLVAYRLDNGAAGAPLSAARTQCVMRREARHSALERLE
jgi:hypothetical protein